jgi:hypothetical protein
MSGEEILSKVVSKNERKQGLDFQMKTNLEF